MSLACPACGTELGERPALTGTDRLHRLPGEFTVVVCTACGSGRTLPYVPSELLGSLYPADYNAYGLPENIVLRAVATLLFRARYARALRADSLSALRGRPPGRLLDVGSGRGDLGLVLQGSGWQVTGLEPSPQACQEARARGVPTERGTLTHDGGRLEGGYDAVVFNHSLEHVAEPAEDLAVAGSLLAESGLLLLSAPNFGSWQRRRFGSAWYHLDLPRHRSHFTARGLELLLAGAGLRTIRMTTSTSPDGLPMSLQYFVLGRRRLDSALGSYAFMGASLLALPLTAASGAAGGGDLLHAVAIKRAGAR
jgi:SAM-dependent methyltransferase